MFNSSFCLYYVPLLSVWYIKLVVVFISAVHIFNGFLLQNECHCLSCKLLISCKVYLHPTCIRYGAKVLKVYACWFNALYDIPSFIYLLVSVSPGFFLYFLLCLLLFQIGRLVLQLLQKSEWWYKSKISQSLLCWLSGTYREINFLYDVGFPLIDCQC